MGHCVLGEPSPEPEAAFLQRLGATAIFEDGLEWRALRSKQFTYAIFRADRSELLFDDVEIENCTNVTKYYFDAEGSPFQVSVHYCEKDEE